MHIRVRTANSLKIVKNFYEIAILYYKTRVAFILYYLSIDITHGSHTNVKTF